MIKKLITGIFVVFLISLPVSVDLSTNIVDAYVTVKGHYRNGTYVAPHVRSNPNGLKYDNYSWTPSQGLYNKTYGTRGDYWDTPTYITDPDYYVGKSIYDSGNNLDSYSYYYGNYSSESFSNDYTATVKNSLTKSSGSKKNINHGYKIGKELYCNDGYHAADEQCLSNRAYCKYLHGEESYYKDGFCHYCEEGYEFDKPNKLEASCVIQG